MILLHDVAFMQLCKKKFVVRWYISVYKTISNFYYMMSYKNERCLLFRSLCTFECYRNSFLFFDISFPPENIIFFFKHFPPKLYENATWNQNWEKKFYFTFMLAKLVLYIINYFGSFISSWWFNTKFCNSMKYISS